VSRHVGGDEPSVRILGPLTVLGADGPTDLGGAKQRVVLAALLAARPHPVPVGRLVDVVWGDSPPARPEASLQAYVSNLRKVLAGLATGPTR
jgi:DNA-binding SARP family transcriptional activator